MVRSALILVALAALSFDCLAQGTSGGARDRLAGYHLPSGQIDLTRANGSADRSFQIGFLKTALVDPIPIAGDFNGDGEDSVGLFDPRTSEFHLRNSNTPGPAGVVFSFGPAYNVPLAGDFDGDGVDTVGVFDPSSNLVQLRNSNTPGPADVSFFFGNPGSLVLVGDFDGDGVDTVGVYDAGLGEFQLRNSNSAGPADVVLPMGPTTSFPLAGDFRGRGRDEVGLFDFNTHEVFLNTDGRSRSLPLQVGEVEGIWYPLVGNWRMQAASLQGTSFPWATSSPVAQNIDPVQFQAAYDQAATLNKLFSFLVVRNGYLVGEEYYSGYRREIAGNIKSISKTLLSALVGIALDQGHFTGLSQTLESILPQYFHGGMDPRKLQITLENMITMRAGFSWNELTFFTPMVNSSDWLQFVLDMPQQTDPGTTFLYCTGLTHAMSRALTEVTGMSTAEYARIHLFEPLGIRAQLWDRDVEGTPFGGSEVFMTPRDLARFGHVFLQDGNAEGTPVIPSSWVDYSTSELVPSSSIDLCRSYGAWWWRKSYGGYQVLYALGWGGQYILNVPDLNLTVVLTSRWDIGNAPDHIPALFDLFENYLLPAIL